MVEEGCSAQCVLINFVWDWKQILALCELVRVLKPYLSKADAGRADSRTTGAGAALHHLPACLCMAAVGTPLKSLSAGNGTDGWPQLLCSETHATFLFPNVNF